VGTIDNEIWCAEVRVCLMHLQSQ